jgi:hypothetical protein
MDNIINLKQQIKQLQKTCAKEKKQINNDLYYDIRKSTKFCCEICGDVSMDRYYIKNHMKSKKHLENQEMLYKIIEFGEI